MCKYVFTEEMREISGFGGSYESACREMLVAGLEWLDAHPDADPKFTAYENIYGVISENNDDAKSLSDAVVAPTKNECTGAMHQAVISHVMWIKQHSWDEYVAEMTKEDEDGK